MGTHSECAALDKDALAIGHVDGDLVPGVQSADDWGWVIGGPNPESAALDRGVIAPGHRDGYLVPAVWSADDWGWVIGGPEPRVCRSGQLRLTARPQRR